MTRMNKVGTHMTTVAISREGWHTVTYHNTEVVKWNDHLGIVILNSDGFETVTTKTRMNQAANQFNLHFQVYQKYFGWYVVLPTGETVEFYDGMEFAYQVRETA